MNNACSSHQKCIDSAIKKAENICLAQKLQFTKLRREVLKLVWSSHVPLKAYEVLELLQESDAKAKPITVYRALDFLLENKLLHKLESQNSFLGCSHPGEDHNCYFIICTKCHVVKEGCETELLQKIYGSLDRQKFKPQHITLEIQGICKACAN